MALIEGIFHISYNANIRSILRRIRQHESSGFYRVLILLLGLSCGYLHYYHVSTLFENDRHFSHLSEMEREMSFRTEMGLYYNYYKIITSAPNYTLGMHRISKDNYSEYGNVINAGRKYTLFPEILMGFLYHMSKYFNLLPADQCYEVQRESNLPPITSCVGAGVPAYFYLGGVWFAAALTTTALFFYSVFINESVISGIISILFFFYNHAEATRVQWTPPLRESFGYPFLLFQMLSITKLISLHREAELRKQTRWKYIGLGPISDSILFTTLSLNSWQFSQFVFATQLFALSILKILDMIPYACYRKICAIHIVSGIISLLLTDGSLVFSSLYFCFIAVSNISHYCIKMLMPVNWKLGMLTEFLSNLILTSHFKTFLLATPDDSHIYNFLRAKISNYQDFHTMLYTCTTEFGNMQERTLFTIIRSMLLPAALFAGIMVLIYWYRCIDNLGLPKCIEPEMAYTALQTAAFILMALLIMRFKLLMTPHLCIIAGGVVSKKYLEGIGVERGNIRAAIVVLLVATMSVHGLEKYNAEVSYLGQFHDPPQEQLLNWIKTNTSQNAVFAGQMSLMPNILLSTGRPIVNNPYYESKEMRDRTLKVYEIYSRKDAASVYMTLKRMKVEYVVLEYPMCFGFAPTYTHDIPPHRKDKCQMVDLWDVTDDGESKAAGQPPLCPLLFKGHSYPFRVAFRNKFYVVLDLNYFHYIEVNPKIISIVKKT